MPETQDHISLQPHTNYNHSNKCLRGTDLDLREGALDPEAHEEVDAPILANALEAAVKITVEVIVIVIETVNENAIVDPGVL